MKPPRSLLAALVWLALLGPGGVADAERGGDFEQQVERAEELMGRGDHRAAVRALEKAAKLAAEPSHRVELNLAVCFNRLGSFDRSAKHARAALAAARQPGEQANAHYMLGLSLASREPAAAEAEFRRTLELTRGGANLARLRLGEVLALQGRSKEACTAFAEFLEVQPVGEGAILARTAMHPLGCVAQAAGPPDLGLWAEARTERFRVVGNGSAARVAEIASGAQRLAATLELLAPGVDLLAAGRISLYAFADGASFAPYRLRPGDVGYLVPHPHGIYAASQTDDGAIRLIHRELVLHFLGTRFPGLPLWFRQGMAEIYSNLRQTAGGVHLGLPIESHLWLVRAVTGEAPVAEVLEADATAAAEIEGFGAWSWVMVHYLVFGEPELNGRVGDYLRLLGELERPGRAFRRAFDLSPEDLGARLLAHARREPMPYLRITSADLATAATSVRELSAIEADLALAELALHVRPAGAAGLLADLRRLARDQPAEPLVWATLGEAESLTGDPAAAVAALRRAVELDGGQAKAHLLLGAALLEVARSQTGGEAAAAYAEAVAALESAAGLRREDFAAWERLSYAYAAQEEPPDRAVAAAARAAALRPGRTDLVLNLLLVRAKRGEVPEVRAELRRLEALGAAADQVARAREILLRLTLREARELMQADRLDDAVAVLAEVDARTTSAELRATARDWMKRIAVVEQHNLFAEAYGRAVAAYEADDWDRAQAVLDELAALARPGMQTRLVELLRAEVDYWRD